MGRKKAETAASNTEPKRGEKTAAIKELFASGVKEASAIDAAMKKRGLSVSKPVIYQTIGKLKQVGRRKPGPKPKAAAAPASTTTTQRQSSPSGLVLEDINQLVEITQKAGGVDVVVGLLQTMKRVQ